MDRAEQFLKELENGTFPVASAREFFAKLAPELDKLQQARALKYINDMELKTIKLKDASELYKIVPKGWFREYLTMAQMSESPDSFHLYSALAVLTHLIGRQMYYSLGTINIYPPISAFLVSPAGAARRSTAIKTALRVGLGASATVIADTVTPEGLIDWLSIEPQTLVVADEATTLLSRSEYMSVMPQILCSLLDCPPQFERKLKASRYTIVNPTVNALIGCAPDWIMTSMPKSAVEGGLFSRMLIVYEQTRKRLIPMPEDEVDIGAMEAMIDSLTRGLRQIANNAKGRISYSPKAKEAFKKFYSENDKAIPEVDDKLAIYLVRKPEHVHRIIMALVAADGMDNEVRIDTLETVLAILALLEEKMPTAYKAAGLEKPGRDQMKVLTVIERAGGKLDHSQLLQRVSSTMNSQDLARCMQSLEEQGVITSKYREGRKGFIKFYSLAKFIT